MLGWRSGVKPLFLVASKDLCSKERDLQKEQSEADVFYHRLVGEAVEQLLERVRELYQTGLSPLAIRSLFSVPIIQQEQGPYVLTTTRCTIFVRLILKLPDKPAEADLL